MKYHDRVCLEEGRRTDTPCFDDALLVSVTCAIHYKLDEQVCSYNLLSMCISTGI